MGKDGKGACGCGRLNNQSIVLQCLGHSVDVSSKGLGKVWVPGHNQNLLTNYRILCSVAQMNPRVPLRVQLVCERSCGKVTLLSSKSLKKIYLSVPTKHIAAETI
jgi:hypothetical protein